MNDNLQQIEDEADQNETPLEGWVQIPVRRGLFEIEWLLNLCQLYGGHIIGGYARYCCSPRKDPVKAQDVDIFPTGGSEERCKEVFALWQSAMASLGIKPKHENNVSVTYDTEGIEGYDQSPTVQLIKPIEEGAILTMGTIEEILGNFDFTIVRVALNRDRRTATAWASFPKDEERRRLRILNIHCPISSLLRCMKYARKGYYMRPVEAMKLFADWMQRPQSYRDKIAELFETGTMGKLSQKEIDELEALLRVD